MSEPLRPIQGPGSTPVQAPQAARTEAGQPSFGAVLERTRQNQELKLSQHAQMRLDSRHMSLSGTDWQSINEAVDLADQKGVRNSLVVKGQIALVVNVPNRTVVTAVDTSQEKVFTNIDGAVIL